MTIIRQSNVTFDRWPEFIAAVEQMRQSPVEGQPSIYDRLVTIHAVSKTDEDGFQYRAHRMHGSSDENGRPIGARRFLPWHRAYLIMFERELRKIDDSLALPYWDYANDGGRLIGVDAYMASAKSRNLGPSAGEIAKPNDSRDWFELEFVVETLENLTSLNYFDFTWVLENGFEIEGLGAFGLHNRGHNWVGGDMETANSPNDILFWMHHAALDRIWARWQEKNPGKIAALKGKDAKLDPWDKQYDIHKINDISKLGADSYSYEDPQRPATP